MPPKRRSSAVEEAKETSPKQQRLKSPSSDPDVDQPLLDVDPTPDGDAAQPVTLYLDTVDRSRLDFDFEKLCSVSLSNVNVYACLICGKYFQGRGKSTHAYLHSLNEDHHIFIHLSTLKVYSLPEGVEIVDPSLDDIKYILAPTYTQDLVTRLSDPSLPPSYTLHRKPYLPGYVGINNIKHNDYVNVILQALVHVPPLRDWLLLTDSSKLPLLERSLSDLARKVWNARAFKGQVSPHELLQEIASVSGKRFALGKLSDPADFLIWFLNQMHKDLGGGRKLGSSKIAEIFQGEMIVESQEAPVVERGTDDLDTGRTFDDAKDIKKIKTNFFLLTTDLPPAPLFQDEQEKNIIPQVALGTLLEKYDGKTIQDIQGVLRRYRITKPPPYLFLHIRRFTKNSWSKEKNPTIVTFPLTNVNFFPYAAGFTGEDGAPGAHYDLLTTISHEGTGGIPEEGTYKAHVRRGKDKWLQIQDLYVEDFTSQMIFLSESYIQVWERRS